MIAAKGGANEPPNMRLPGKAGGTVAVRRTLASTICRIADPTLVARPRQLCDVSTVMRFQPAHQSMINRRHDGRASCLAWYSPKQALERKLRIYAPATRKGGHESDTIHTLRTRFRCDPWRAAGITKRAHGHQPHALPTCVMTYVPIQRRSRSS